MPAANHTMNAPPVPNEPGKYDWIKQPRPAIYEASPVNEHSLKLIDSAEYPVPSPDGNKIAYFGWSDKMEDVPESVLEAESKDDKVPHRVLAIFDHQTSKGKLAMDTQPYSMLWTHDGKTLIALQVTGETEADNSYEVEGDIIAIDTLTLKRKKIATLHAKDCLLASRDFLHQQFELSQITKGGWYLLVNKSDYTGTTAAMFNEQKTFLAIDLKTGEDSYLRPS